MRYLTDQSDFSGGAVCFTEGENLVEFEVQWPEIREGDYFITLGIGKVWKC